MWFPHHMCGSMGHRLVDCPWFAKMQKMFKDTNVKLAKNSTTLKNKWLTTLINKVVVVVWGFINQVGFIIQLHQHRYLDNRTQVGLINTLLLDTTLTWFAPFLEHQSPLLDNFEAFFEKISASFGDSNKENITKNKLQALCQGSRPTSMYASEYKQLTCDISWDGATFMSQFQFGFHGNVKDLLLTMHDPTTLSQVIV